jgi:hypothetical protein
MELSIEAYNFLAEKNYWNTVSTAEDLDSECKKHYIKKMFSTISVSDYTVIDNVYTWGNSYSKDNVLGAIKEVNGEVTEYYTRPSQDFVVPGPSPINARVEWVSRDLNTNETIEYYLYDRTDIITKEFRYNMEGTLIQTTNIISNYISLPKEYQDALVGYSNKDNIWSYSTNSEGMIIEIIYP